MGSESEETHHVEIQSRARPRRGRTPQGEPKGKNMTKKTMEEASNGKVEEFGLQKRKRITSSNRQMNAQSRGKENAGDLRRRKRGSARVNDKTDPPRAQKEMPPLSPPEKKEKKTGKRL